VRDTVAEGDAYFPVFCELPENEDYRAGTLISHRAFELVRDKAAAIAAGGITHMLSLVQDDHIHRTWQFLRTHAAAITAIRTAQTTENGVVLEMIGARAREIAVPHEGHVIADPSDCQPEAQAS
jgi:hypothetical protein